MADRQMKLRSSRHLESRFNFVIQTSLSTQNAMVSPLHALVSGSEVEVLVPEGRGPGNVPEHGEGVGGVGAGPRRGPREAHRGKVRGEVVSGHLQLSLRLRRLAEDGAGRLGPSALLKVAGEEREASTSVKLFKIYQMDHNSFKTILF